MLRLLWNQAVGMVTTNCTVIAIAVLGDTPQLFAMARPDFPHCSLSLHDLSQLQHG
jgi:hypothetical protein